MRAKEVSVCAHAALAADFFYRYHIQKDTFPDVSLVNAPMERAQQILPPGVLGRPARGETANLDAQAGEPDTSDVDEETSGDDEDDEVEPEAIQWYNHQLVKGRNRENTNIILN